MYVVIQRDGMSDIAVYYEKVGMERFEKDDSQN